MVNGHYEWNYVWISSVKGEKRAFPDDLPINEIKFPIIIISCKNDERVPISHPERVYSYSKNSKYVAFDYCEDHGEAYETNKEKFMEEFEKYFENKF